MTDIIDRACELEQQQRELALRNRSSTVKRAVRFCVDCEEELPEIRQKMGANRCVCCQTIIEQKQRHYR